jgi:hypothetical protein
MKKLALILILLSFSMAANAQKKKAPAKTANTTKSTALTKTDANNFIIYANSVNEFFKNSFDDSDYLVAYNQFMNINQFPNEYLPCLSKMEETAFTNAYAQFNTYVVDSDQTEFVQLSKTPSKMNPIKASEIKQLFKDYEAKYIEMAMCFTEKIQPFYIDCKLDKKANKETLAANLLLFNNLTKELNNIHESIFAISDVLGDEGENIILENHPYKNEIIDMRTLIKIVRKPTELAQIEKRADFAAVEPEIQKYLDEMATYKTKYANYTTTGKTPKDEEMREKVVRFFKNIESFSKTMNDYATCIKDSSCKDYYVNDFRLTLISSYEGLIFDYGLFVRSNNRD